MSLTFDVDSRFTDPTWYRAGDHHQEFRRLRDEDPVHWSDNKVFGRSYWLLTRHEDVKNYLQNDRVFSSRWDARFPRTPYRRTPEERYAFGVDVAIQTLDNPLHDVYRRPMNKHFSKPAISRMAPTIESIVDELIANVAARGSADIVEDLAEGLTTRTILRLIGAPQADWAMLREATGQKLSASDPKYNIDGDSVKTSLTGHRRLYEYSVELATTRREQPEDDFASVVAEMMVDGDKLSPHEMATWCSTIISGGLETTRNAAAVGLWLFLTNPGQRELLLSEPTLIDSAVEEVLRWVTPGPMRLRVATEDIELHGKLIRTNDWVVGVLSSANRDERVFPNAEQFDITRNPNPHLTFGAGTHGCLGRHLARLELATFFPKVLRAFPDMTISEAPTWIADSNVVGFSTLPVDFTPRGGGCPVNHGHGA